jgi:hypothetical protein
MIRVSPTRSHPEAKPKDLRLLFGLQNWHASHLATNCSRSAGNLKKNTGSAAKLLDMFDKTSISREPPSVLGLVAVTVFLLSLPVLFLWANDVREDRAHTVTVISPTPVFTGSGSDNDCYMTRQHAEVAVEQPGTTLRVRRIRYWKDCATVNVVLPNGKSGHIVLGVGNVSGVP